MEKGVWKETNRKKLWHLSQESPARLYWTYGKKYIAE
jgi:hypothetical protein